MENTICPQCGGPVQQSGKGRPRRFCSPGCGIKFANDAKPRKHGTRDEYLKARNAHMLTNLDTATGTADCAVCGPGVRVWDVGGTKRVKWRCMNAVESQPGRIRHKHGRGREAAWARRGIDMTVDRFNVLLAEQDGGCAICGVELGPRAKTTHVDHCHTTGTVRGILCSTCNRVLGLAKDDPARLRASADYLERAGVRS